MKNLTLDYADTGAGIPVLLIHGFPLSRVLWEPQLAELGDVARMIAPDLRGHGTSVAGAGPFTMADMAADCRGVLEAAGLTGPVVVAGLSMGGYVAFEFYRRYPERVAGLILAGTRAAADSAEGKAKRDQAAATVRAEGVGAIVAAMLPKMFAPVTYSTQPALVARAETMMAGTSLAGVVGALAAMRDRADSLSLLPKIDKPVLVLHGAADQIVPLPEAQAMAAAIPQARLEVLPAAGHLLNMEDPATCNAAIRRYLASAIQ